MFVADEINLVIKIYSTIVFTIWFALLTAYKTCCTMETIEHIAASLRAHHSAGYVCKACCKRFESTLRFDCHSTSHHLLSTVGAPLVQHRVLRWRLWNFEMIATGGNTKN